MDEMTIISRLNERQRLVFLAEKKNPTTGLLLCLFLGGIGGHQFYLGNNAGGVMYLLFCWTLIPGIIALFELFAITNRVRDYNRKLALRISGQVA
jgi:TM2 domain-containing membrane protein YozV